MVVVRERVMTRACCHCQREGEGKGMLSSGRG